ncbi:MAG: hypothetical protein WC595_00190 [Candidatus Nanoarchaeia archaeon]
MKRLLSLAALVTALTLSKPAEAEIAPRLVVKTTTVAVPESPAHIAGELEFEYEGYVKDGEDQGSKTTYQASLLVENGEWSGKISPGAELIERYKQPLSSSFTLEGSMRRVSENTAVRIGLGYGSSAKALIHNQTGGEGRAEFYGRVGRNFGGEVDAEVNVNIESGEFGGKGKATLLYEGRIENIDLRVAGSGAVERNQYDDTTRVAVGLEGGVNVGDVFNARAGFLALPDGINGFRKYYGQLRLFEGSRVSLTGEASVKENDDLKEVRASLGLEIKFN